MVCIHFSLQLELTNDKPLEPKWFMYAFVMSAWANELQTIWAYVMHATLPGCMHFSPQLKLASYKLLLPWWCMYAFVSSNWANERKTTWAYVMHATLPQGCKRFLKWDDVPAGLLSYGLAELLSCWVSEARLGWTFLTQDGPEHCGVSLFCPCTIWVWRDIFACCVFLHRDNSQREISIWRGNSRMLFYHGTIPVLK